jgi:peroxiredoxin
LDQLAGRYKNGLERLEELDYTVQAMKDMQGMRDRFELKIQILSDTDLDVAPEYAGVQETDSRGEIPIPGVFVIDTDGVVREINAAFCAFTESQRSELLGTALSELEATTPVFEELIQTEEVIEGAEGELEEGEFFEDEE